MFESKLNKGKIGGYAGLNGNGKVPVENIVYNNFSKTITVCENDLLGNGTIEQRLLDYLNLIDFKKTNFDSDINIVVENCDPVDLTLDITVFSGSVIVVFVLTASRKLPQDVSLSVEFELGLNSGGTINVPATILIEKNNLSGETTVVLAETNYNDLSGTSNLAVGQLSKDYDYVVNANIIFDIPIPSGSGGSGDVGGVGGGIGLSLLD
jgi:hypothetical protein